ARQDRDLHIPHCGESPLRFRLRESQRGFRDPGRAAWLRRSVLWRLRPLRHSRRAPLAAQHPPGSRRHRADRRRLRGLRPFRGHPAGARPYSADPEGRLVLLHGAIPGGLIDFWSGTDPTKPEPAPHYPIDPAAYAGRCPANSATIRVPPLCQNDVSEMRALGFNVIRLALSWSLLEPQRGIYSRQYLDRVAQVV